jgi:hypothetical protein
MALPVQRDRQEPLPLFYLVSLARTVRSPLKQDAADARNSLYLPDVFTLRWCHTGLILTEHQIFSVKVYFDEHPRMLSTCRLAIPSS